MKILITSIIYFLFLVAMAAQSKFEIKAKEIAEQIEQITLSEKILLKEKIAEINDKLYKGEISKDVAERLSMEAAQASSDSISSLVSIMQDEFTQLIQDKVNEDINEADMEKVNMDPSPSENDSASDEDNENKYGHHWNFDFNFKNRNESRHTSQFVFAIGVNSLINGSDFSTLKSSPLHTSDSKFYEYGFSGKYRLIPSSNLLQFKYGLSLLYLHLSPKGNNYYAVQDAQTNITAFDGSLTKNDLRNVYITAPFHLEIDFTKTRKNKEGNIKFRTQKAVRLGVGGFFGIKTASKQKLEYYQNGNKFELKEKGDFNVNQFAYGLSAYLGYRSWTIYGNYQLNPVFENNALDQRMVSIGLRLDWN